jgi:ubiquinone/menaquinone biosynthesis C-methylase UbiE
VIPATAHSRVYDAWSLHRKGWNPHFCAPILERGLAYLERRTSTNGVVLDLGCGLGQVAEAFAACGFRAVGVDIVFDGMEASPEGRPSAEFVNASMTALPVADACSDACFAYSSFQYSDRAAILSECARVLRPGAPFVVVENMTANPVAVLERWRTRRQNGRDSKGHRQKVHLRSTQIRQFDLLIGPTSCEYFHLTTPILLAFADAFDESGPVTVRSRVVRFVYANLSRTDRWLLSRLEFLQPFAWQVLITGHRATSAPWRA